MNFIDRYIRAYVLIVPDDRLTPALRRVRDTTVWDIPLIGYMRRLDALNWEVSGMKGSPGVLIKALNEDIKVRMMFI